MVDIYRAVVTLPSTTGNTKDRATNRWHFQTIGLVDPPEQDTAERIRDILTDWYSTPVGDGTIVSSLLGPQVSRLVPSTIAITKRPTPFLFSGKERWGSPKWTFDLVLNAVPGGDNGRPLPNECAIANSFRADYGDLPEFAPDGSRPRATRRNHNRLGPLCRYALTEVGTHPAVAHIDTIIAASQRLFDAGNGEFDSVQWAVYSEKEHDAFKVIGGWVDDEMDTCASRQLPATARTSW